MRKLQTICFLLFVFVTGTAVAQEARQEYLTVITGRADKIVSTLGITDSTQYYKVRSLLVKEYDQVNAHHESKRKKIQKIKEKNASDKEVQQAKIAKVERVEANKLRKLNARYVANLSKILTKQQVESIKDGMTYSVLPRTYVAYQEMIPSLTAPQKEFVLSNLTEARELAMAQPGSKEKHAVFGKYKGRINNYLSKEGYDLKEEGKRWEERIKNEKAVL